MNKLNVEYAGICSNCRFTSNCSHRDRAHNIISSCEEHESYREERALHKSSNATSVKSFEGLCSNCENVDQCMLPDKGKIIFTCEEYK